jgi:DNA-binding IclR family transcriptional regulator
MGTESSRQGVEAAEVVGTILQALLRLPRPARLKDLELATGIASAKLHRYLVSMIRCGLARRHESGNRYDFGLLTYRLGQVAAHDSSVLSLLEPMFEQFVAQLDHADLGQAVGVGQWVGHGATIVRWFESDSTLSVRMKPGINLTVTGSATAMLLAAYLPRDVTEPIVREELVQKGMDTDEAVEKIYKEYARIREMGIAGSLGSRRTNLNGLSAPLFDHRGEVIAAITIMGMAPHFNAELDGSVAKSLLKLSREMSMQIGNAQTHRL